MIHRRTLRQGDDPGGPSGAVTEVLTAEAGKGGTAAQETWGWK